MRMVRNEMVQIDSQDQMSQIHKKIETDEINVALEKNILKILRKIIQLIIVTKKLCIVNWTYIHTQKVETQGLNKMNGLTIHLESNSKLKFSYIYIHIHTYIYIYIHTHTHTHIYKASLVSQMVKNPCSVQQTQFQSLGQEDRLEKRMATHSSILA